MHIIDQWASGLLWKPGALQVIDGRGRRRGLHTAGGVCTGVLRGAVGRVGNEVRNGVDGGGFPNVQKSTDEFWKNRAIGKGAWEAV